MCLDRSNITDALYPDNQASVTGCWSWSCHSSSSRTRRFLGLNLLSLSFSLLSPRWSPARSGAAITAADGRVVVACLSVQCQCCPGGDQDQMPLQHPDTMWQLCLCLCDMWHVQARTHQTLQSNSYYTLSGRKDKLALSACLSCAFYSFPNNSVICSFKIACEGT